MWNPLCCLQDNVLADAVQQLLALLATFQVTISCDACDAVAWINWLCLGSKRTSGSIMLDSCWWPSRGIAKIFSNKDGMGPTIGMSTCKSLHVDGRGRNYWYRYFAQVKLANSVIQAEKLELDLATCVQQIKGFEVRLREVRRCCFFIVWKDVWDHIQKVRCFLDFGCRL